MTAETAIFLCSICEERSSDICVACTKDACANHRCARCKRCSDCCECEMPLSAAEALALGAEEPAVPIVLPEVLEPEAVAEPVTAEEYPSELFAPETPAQPEPFETPDIPELFRPETPKRTPYTGQPGILGPDWPTE